MSDRSRLICGRAVQVGFTLIVFSLAMLVLTVAGRQDVAAALLPSIPLAGAIGCLCRMVVDDEWPAFRRRANEVEAARINRHHQAMAAQPAVDLGVFEVDPDVTSEEDLRMVLSHRAPRQRKAGAR